MRSNRKKKIFIVFGILVVLSLVVGISIRRGGQDIPQVQVEKIKRRATLESKVTANGEIRPKKEFKLTAEVPGRVQHIYVKEGDMVKAGTPLLQIDQTQLSAELQGLLAQIQIAESEVQNVLVQIDAAKNNVLSVEASLQASKHDLERSKADLKFAEDEYKRQEKLLEEMVISRQGYERALTTYRTAQSVVRSQESRVNQLEVQLNDAKIRVRQTQVQFDSARGRVRQLRANLAGVNDRMSKTIQKAPIDGVVGGLLVKEGEVVVATFQSTPLMTIADMSEVNVEVQVDETDITNVRMAQKAKIKVDALEGQELEGEVSEVARAPIGGGGGLAGVGGGNQQAKDFKVVIKLALTDEVRDRLRPGMSATATITTDARENAVAVPQSALVERDASEVGQTASQDNGAGNQTKKAIQGVFVAQAQRAIFRPVQTGIIGEMDVEVISGLDEGMDVIVGPYSELRKLKHNSPIGVMLK
jgi:HlyD family secretion protein